jgi:F-type H+-transporting ATPase subunit epsilon
MRAFHLEIVTPDGSAFDGEAESLLVRTDGGDVEILAGHADYIAALSVGRARIRTSAGERIAAISGGFLSVDKKSVKLVATTFEFADEIDIKRAAMAKENAEAAITRAKSDRELELAKAKLARALSRINVAEGK